jgi:Right handed beta helix region
MGPVASPVWRNLPPRGFCCNTGSMNPAFPKYSPPFATRGHGTTTRARGLRILGACVLGAALATLSGCSLLQMGASSGKNPPNSPAPSNTPNPPAPPTPPAPPAPPNSPPPPSSLPASGPIVLRGQSGKVIQGLHISSTSGDCVQLIDSSNITITNSEIGPCAGNAVHITGGDQISIFDSYIHPETLSPTCCDNNDGVIAIGPSHLSIQGNVIAYGESNIEVQDSNVVTVVGNLLLNPRGEKDGGRQRGNNFQCWSQTSTSSGCSNVTVQNNYVLSSIDTSTYLYPEATQDSVSFGHSRGIVVKQNYITGGHSAFGCALIADLQANSVQFINNDLIDTGQCGIGIADGTNQLLDGNRVINRNPVSGSGNQAVYVWQSYGSNGNCSNVTVKNQIATQYKPDGLQTGYWQGPGCEPVTLTNNVFGKSADNYLTPVHQMMPAPLIPPQPKTCVVMSPYSSQSGTACTP